MKDLIDRLQSALIDSLGLESAHGEVLALWLAKPVLIYRLGYLNPTRARVLFQKLKRVVSSLEKCLDDGSMRPALELLEVLQRPHAASEFAARFGWGLPGAAPDLDIARLRKDLALLREFADDRLIRYEEYKPKFQRPVDHRMAAFVTGVLEVAVMAGMKLSSNPKSEAARLLQVAAAEAGARLPEDPDDNRALRRLLTRHLTRFCVLGSTPARRKPTKTPDTNKPRRRK